MTGKNIEKYKSRIGESKKTVENFKIEEGKVEEFARAIKDDNPAYRNKEDAIDQGYEDIPAPLTFPRISIFPRYRPDNYEIEDHFLLELFDIDFDLMYTVNGEVTFKYERQLYVGDVLYGITTLSDVYQKEGSSGGLMTFVVFQNEYRDQNDDLVVTVELTLIETEDAIEESNND
jgi:hypothetical protein